MCSIKGRLQHRTREGGFLKSTQNIQVVLKLENKELSLKVYFVF